VLLQLGAPKGKQWPNYRSVARRHSGQTGRTGAGENPHQNRLDLIVGVVAGEDHTCAGPEPSLLQPEIAAFPGLGLGGSCAQPEPTQLNRQAVSGCSRSNLIRNPATL